MPYKDIEKRRACKRRWYQKNKDYFKKWHEAHPEFTQSRTQKLGLLRRTHSPTRERIQGNRLKSLYGLSRAEYQQKLTEQNGVCAICNKPERRKTPEGLVWSMCVDHKHDDVKQVRGLLCADCNAAIGLFKEDSSILTSAIAYLAKWTTI
jgi:hypothetical protein